jgi:ADP-heptose:LPS heptosyltransferase
VPFKDQLRHLALRTLASTWSRPSTPLNEIRTFVILQHAKALGTAIHSTPLIPALRAAVPDARIHVLASGFGLEVYRNNPGVDRLVEMPNPTQDRFAFQTLRKHLPAEPFATLTPTGNERTSVALAARMANADSLCGFTLASELYRQPLFYNDEQSQIANNLRIIEALGHAPSSHHEPEIFFTKEDQTYAESLLIDRDPSRPLIAFVTQTYVAQRKSWRQERFIAVAKHLQSVHNAEIVFVGTRSEHAAVETLRSQLQGATWNVAGETSIPQLAALLSLCAAGLTLDTGTMHIGRAIGLPMVIIAPAWSAPIEWLPLGDSRFRVLKKMDLPSSPPDYMIDEVTVADAISALDDLLTHDKRN